MTKIKGVIFDMDGLLIDSEPLWRKAICSIYNDLGYSMTEQMAASTMGMRSDEVAKYWLSYFDDTKNSYKDVELNTLSLVQELIEKEGVMMPYVQETLDFFKHEQIPIAIASSSPLGIIQSVVDKLGIKRYFKVMCSAEFEEYGKPHPSVFISTANYLRVAPTDCLVFEDSISGVIAAKAAKMQCIAVPSKQDYDNPKFALADLKIRSLKEFLEKEKK
ncbi:MAG: hexitol phosphatase HxpB [Chitinophagales bacterium]|nr:hexitol phosphatase HxpB [Chitinophagales bacterium]